MNIQPRIKINACPHLCVMVGNATATTLGNVRCGDFICFGVVLRSYQFVLGDWKWNWVRNAINDGGLHLCKEDFLSIVLKKIRRNDA